tara:strand:+ start:50 stop:1030 length:981 start_codon:yes stop_codon:yes gene_type:complete
MKTPVLIIVYTRPETTIHVVNALRQIKAESIYIYQGIPNTKKKSQDFQNYIKVSKIIQNINWKCRVKLKKQKGVDSYHAWKLAVKWFFKNEKEGIILEDDIVPNNSFFIFCSKLLKKYRHDRRIAQICGTSFLNQKKISNESYIFSNYSLGWGWATWRRSIIDFDEKMKDWPKMKKNKTLLKIINDKKFMYYWSKVFDNQYKNISKAWDERWLYSNWKNNKLSIIPKKHLVKNIGFGENATHTKIKHWYSNLETNEIKYINKHPKKIIANKEYDCWLNTNVYGIKFHYIKQKILNNKVLNIKIIFKIIRVIYKLIKPLYRIKKPMY